MQAAKDTFLKTLAGRLAVVNSSRTVMVDGVARPAVLAVENEAGMAGMDQLPHSTKGTLSGASPLETFLLSWEGATHVMPEGRLMQVDCTVSYGSKGTDAMLGTDRGRIVNAMDAELQRICEPRQSVKNDYTQNPPAALGTNIFWTRPEPAEVSVAHGVLTRTATIRLFFFPEVR